MCEHDIKGTELSEDMLNRVAGGLTPSQVGQRGDPVPTVSGLDSLRTPLGRLPPLSGSS